MKGTAWALDFAASKLLQPSLIGDKGAAVLTMLSTKVFNFYETLQIQNERSCCKKELRMAPAMLCVQHDLLWIDGRQKQRCCPAESSAGLSPNASPRSLSLNVTVSQCQSDNCKCPCLRAKPYRILCGSPGKLLIKYEVIRFRFFRGEFWCRCTIRSRGPKRWGRTLSQKSLPWTSM